MIGQTLTILLDAYRERHARKLFWIAMGLSGLVVAAFAMVGVNAAGNVTFLIWETPIPVGSFGWTAADLYKLIFVQFGIGFWLAWLTTILALITTAGIFPEFISSGSIDLVLSKPIGRWRLFFTKYATGLLFVTGQVLVFTLATFLVLGVRGGDWEPSLFIAVPIVVVFYSYLFSICVLFGMVTRSAMASLLLTLLVWFVIFAMNATDSILVQQRESQRQRVEQIEGTLTRLESDHADRLASSQGGALDTARNGLRQRNIDGIRARLEDEQGSLETVTRWSDRVILAKTILPKTTETIDLLERWLIDLADLPDLATTDFDQDQGFRSEVRIDVDDDVQEQVDEALREARAAQRREGQRDDEQLAALAMRQRSVAWVAGTSLGFELVMLLIAGWLFNRRDF
jgi:hypothetical protein